MGKSNKLGSEGEQMAADYLKDRGWEILEMNYRHSRQEIDLIAKKSGLLIFVEVKARTNISFGHPEAFVDEKKAQNIMSAADHYIHEHNWHGDIRFDIISILKRGKIELSHIEDAFH